MTLLLSNADVHELLPMPECIAALEDAYRELAAGRGTNRRRSDSFVPTARPDALYSLKSMDGIVPKLGVGAVRINSDVVSSPTRAGTARREKVPAASGGRCVGLVLLFSSETGEPLAIFPDGYLQRLRVGATNGLGTKYLARPCAVRKVERVRCYSTDRARREAFAREWSEALGLTVVVALTRDFSRLGALEFGGPITLAGYLHRNLVARRGWVSEDTYRLSHALAQIMPGPLAAQLAMGLAGAAS